MRDIYYSKAVNEALDEELERDKNVVLIGEDIGLYGGAFGVTKGLWEKYGVERIFETPISEGSFMGLAVGAAMTGLRPVVEIMFMDFIALALDQMLNSARAMREALQEGCMDASADRSTPAASEKTKQSATSPAGK